MTDIEQYARERFELNRQKQTLREQQQQRLTVHYNGGMFRVDMTLLTFLYMKNANAGLFQHSTKIIIPDLYDTPIEVDCVDLVILCEERWNEVHNDWHNQFCELKTKRRVGEVEV